MEREKEERLKVISGAVCINIATIVWATNMVLGRFLKDYIGPVSISAIRFLIASMVFALLLQRQPVKERQLGEDRWLLVAMALTGVVVFSPVLYLGLRYTTAVNCTLINALTPLMTGICAAWLIKEPMTGRQVWGSVAALCGVAVLLSGGSLSLLAGFSLNIGDFYVLLSVAIWGVYAVIGSRVMRHRSSLSATAFSTFIGVPLLCILAVGELQSLPAQFDYRVMAALLYIGTVPSAVGFYSWNAGVAKLGPSGAAVFYNTLPLYGALLGYFLLDEPIGWPHILGGLLIIGGGLFAVSGKIKVADSKC